MKLTRNESTIDRAARIVIGAVLAVLALSGLATGAPAVVAWVVAAIAVVTGIAGFCPLYALLRVGTRSKAA